MSVFLTAGETIALLDPEAAGPPRLGVKTRWLSKLGDDELGAAARFALEAEGADLRWTASDAGAPTGLFFKVRSNRPGAVIYYRAGSAASRLEPADVPEEALEDVGLVHLTGITLALSESCRELVYDLARRARGMLFGVAQDTSPATLSRRGLPSACCAAGRPSVAPGPDT